MTKSLLINTFFQQISFSQNVSDVPSQNRFMAFEFRSFHELNVFINVENLKSIQFEEFIIWRIKGIFFLLQSATFSCIIKNTFFSFYAWYSFNFWMKTREKLSHINKHRNKNQTFTQYFSFLLIWQLLITA